MTAEKRSIASTWPSLLIVLAAVAAVGFFAFAKKSPGVAVATFALFPLALVTVLLPAMVGFASARSAKPLARRLSALPASTEIAVLDDYPAGLSFYLGKTITIISRTAEPMRSNFIVYWLRHVTARPATIVAPAERDRWLASRRLPLYILASEYSHADLEGWMGSRATLSPAANGWWAASIPAVEGH